MILLLFLKNLFAFLLLFFFKNQIIKILFEKKQTVFCFFDLFIKIVLIICCSKFCKYNKIEKCLINIFFLIKKKFEIKNNTIRIFIFTILELSNHILTSFSEEFFL